ncbi:hypothetical protein EHW64_12340 [Erwinia psidii]|uniref:hypothetical protein n=1 Tax=Erwinia psidii TaxID=69224 RepID=UPI00226B5064|nr:hypothetical protein [Erwinia psidii]MCX8961898.1 hypothetical protein [Erwinia psidii]
MEKITSEASNSQPITHYCNNTESRPPPKNMLAHVTNITNLPVELQQKIAFNLTPQDYENLRKSAPTLKNNLESSDSIYEKLRNGQYHGEYKKTLQAFVSRPVRDFLKSTQGENLFNAIKSIDVTKNDNTIFIKYKNPINGTLNNIDDIFHWNLNQNNNSFPVLSNYSQGEKTIILSKEKITKKDIKNIFNSLSETFNSTEKYERYFIATVAIKIKTLLCNHPPKEISKDKMEEIFHGYTNILKASEDVNF